MVSASPISVRPAIASNCRLRAIAIRWLRLIGHVAPPSAPRFCPLAPSCAPVAPPLPPQDGPYFALHCDVSADNNYFLTGHNGFESVGCELKLFDRRMGRKVVEVQAASQALTDACFVHVDGSPNGQLYAASSSKDGTLKLWDLAALLAAGEDVALSGRPLEEGLVAVQHLDQPESVQSVVGAAQPPQGDADAAARPGHATIATGHINGRVSVWDVDVQRKQFQLLMQSQGSDN